MDNQHVLLLFHGSLQLSFPQSWQIYMLVYKQYPEVSTNAVKWPQHQNDRIQGYHIVSTLCSNQNKWETHTCTHKYKTSNKYVSSFSNCFLQMDWSVLPTPSLQNILKVLNTTFYYFYYFFLFFSRNPEKRNFKMPHSAQK